MMRAPFRQTLLGTIGLMLATAAVAQEAQQAPAAPDAATTRPARTELDEINEVLAFEQKFVIDAYKQRGHRDPKWDADAVKLIEAQVRASRSDATDRFYKLPDVMPAEDRALLADKVISAECDDAIVLYQAGLAHRAAKESPAEAFGLAAKAAPASPYASVYRLLIARAAIDNGSWRYYAAGPEGVEKLKALYKEQLAATLTDAALLPAHRLPLWILARDVLAPDDEAQKLELADLVEPIANDDPWLTNLTMGIGEINRAWAARGSGLANSVTDDGWKKFAEHLAAARGRFQKAIEADDALPQPFAQMITVAMGESSGHERAWFEHAIARQRDYSPAISRYQNALLPRWGGSHVEMFEAGIRAVDAGGFDTRMPAMLLTMIDAIEEESPLDERQERRVYPQVARCLDGYVEKSPRADVRRWARSARAAWAARLKDWPAAHAQLTALRDAKETADPEPFGEMGLRLDDVAVEAAVRAGPHAKEIEAAQARPVAERGAAIAAVVARLDAADPVRPWLVTLQANTELAAGLAGGWTPLPIPADLAGWRQTAGTWRVEPGGTLVGTGAREGMMIVANLDLPHRYELRLTVAGKAEQPERMMTAAVTATATLHTPPPRVGSNGWVTVTPDKGKGFVAGQGKKAGEFPLPGGPGESATVILRVAGNEVAAVDDKGTVLAEATTGLESIFRDQLGNAVGTVEVGDGGIILRDPRGRLLTDQGKPAPQAAANLAGEARRLAFGAWNRGGVTWRFSKIEVRKLD